MNRYKAVRLKSDELTFRCKIACALRWPQSLSLGRNRRGTVAIMTAILAPTMIMLLSMAIEVTYWSINQIELQRIADAAAWAGTKYYGANIGTTNVVTNAESAAVNVAEINGIGINNVSASGVSGIQVPSNQAFQVTVSRSIPKNFSGYFSSAGSVTISATAIAEYVQTTTTVAVPANSPQPCLLTLATSGAAATGILLDGSSSINASGCSIVSDSGISITGGTGITASAGVYAATSISNTLGTNITGTQYKNNPVVPDPYSSEMNRLFSNITGNGPSESLSNSQTKNISPGQFSSIDVEGGSTLNMAPGTYYVNGDVTLANGGTIACPSCNGSSTVGTGVTIISSGALQLQGGGKMTLIPPQAVSSPVASGVLFASNTTKSGQVGNGATPPSGGLIYYPNGAFSLVGSVAGSLGCNEYIVYTMHISGASNFSSACSNYGLKTFYSSGTSVTTSSVVLVE